MKVDIMMQGIEAVTATDLHNCMNVAGMENNPEFLSMLENQLCNTQDIAGVLSEGESNTAILDFLGIVMPEIIDISADTEEKEDIGMLIPTDNEVSIIFAEDDENDKICRVASESGVIAEVMSVYQLEYVDNSIANSDYETVQIVDNSYGMSVDSEKDMISDSELTEHGTLTHSAEKSDVTVGDGVAIYKSSDTQEVVTEFSAVQQDNSMKADFSASEDIIPEKSTFSVNTAEGDIGDDVVLLSQVKYSENSAEVVTKPEGEILNLDETSEQIVNSKEEIQFADTEDKNESEVFSGKDFSTNQKESVESQSKSADITGKSTVESLVNDAVTLNSLDFAGRSSEYILEDALLQKDISAQTFSALNEGIAKGREEFIIKLTPEGLGDIIVKFVKSDESLLIRMFASDEKTAQLLNQELGVLENMLKPHNAEIVQVEYRQNDMYRETLYDSNDHGYRAGENSESRQEHPSQKQSFGASSVYDILSDVSANEDKTDIISYISGNTILNRYI